MEEEISHKQIVHLNKYWLCPSRGICEVTTRTEPIFVYVNNLLMQNLLYRLWKGQFQTIMKILIFLMYHLRFPWDLPKGKLFSKKWNSYKLILNHSLSKLCALWSKRGESEAHNINTDANQTWTKFSQSFSGRYFKCWC